MAEYIEIRVSRSYDRVRDVISSSWSSSRTVTMIAVIISIVRAFVFTCALTSCRIEPLIVRSEEPVQ